MMKNDIAIALALPDYVIERNERATRAGLIIERQGLWKNRLLTRYRGTLTQLGNAGLISNMERIRKSKAKVWPYCNAVDGAFHPDRIDATLRRIGDDEFRLIVTETLPLDAEDFGNGVRVYWFRRKWEYSGKSRVETRKIFVAKDRDTLIRAGVATEEIKRQECTYKREYCGEEDASVLIWEIHDESSGVVCYTVYQENTAKYEEFEKQRNLYDYASSDEWLENIEDRLCSVLDIFLSEHLTLKTKSGFEYSIVPSEAAAIKSEIETAAQRIRSLNVKVRALTVPSKSKVYAAHASAAAGDPKFQGFMQATLGNCAKDNRK